MPAREREDPDRSDADGGHVAALPRACSFDSAAAFAFARGGPLDMVVPGGLRLDRAGRGANRMVSGTTSAGPGGATGLVAGAWRMAVALHSAARTRPRIARLRTLPSIAARRVTLLATGMAVIDRGARGMPLVASAGDGRCPASVAAMTGGQP